MPEPLSRSIRVDALPKEGQAFSIEADAAERAALAALNGAPEIASFVATFEVKPQRRGEVRVRGAVHAELTQICVVSLDPFPAVVDEAIDVRFAPAPEAGAPRRPAGEEEAFSIADEDEPDPIVDGKIDLGALAAEFFTLGLDPYPRKPGVVFAPTEFASPTHSPFAGLKGAVGPHATGGGRRRR